MADIRHLKSVCPIGQNSMLAISMKGSPSSRFLTSNSCAQRAENSAEPPSHFLSYVTIGPTPSEWPRKPSRRSAIAASLDQQRVDPEVRAVLVVGGVILGVEIDRRR